MNFIKAVIVKRIIKPFASKSIITTFFNSSALKILSLLAGYYFTFFSKVLFSWRMGKSKRNLL